MSKARTKDTLETLGRWAKISAPYGGAGAGAVIPGLAYFNELAPPLFEEAGLITPPLALFMIVVGHHYQPSDEKESRLPIRVKLAFKGVICSLCIIVLYLVLLNLCTVVASDQNVRFQVGFGRADFSLTRDGKDWKRDHPEQTPEEWMLAWPAFKPNGPKLIWKEWTIVVSGVLMTVAFMTMFVLWSLSWALLAREVAAGHSMDSGGPTKSDDAIEPPDNS